MQYLYNSKSLPPLDADVLKKLDDAAASLVSKARNVDTTGLPLSEEAAECLRQFQEEPAPTMRKFIHLMAWVLYPRPAAGELAFVDHGGALGLMSFFAREAGFRTVVYNDIFEPWCRDARLLGDRLKCAADAYIQGEIHDIVGYFDKHPCEWCGLVSVNVIEHIYDMNDFLRRAANLPAGAVTLVLSTSANPMNPVVRWRHHRHHREWEYRDGPRKGFVLMQNTRAFYNVRLDIVRAAAPQISESDVALLAAATRGRRKDEIEAAVEHFQKTGQLLVQPDHPTNTCDPLTGNWEERLLDIQSLSKLLESDGFNVRISGGYYDGRARGMARKAIKGVAARVLNGAISRAGEFGARLAPCITLHASRTGPRKSK